jgi:hypothetical protein
MEFERPHLVAAPLQFAGNIYGSTTRQGFATASVNLATNAANLLVGWWTCREEFSPYFKDDTATIFFSLPSPESIVNLASFFADLEKQIGLTDNTQFNLTVRGKETVVFVPGFWRESLMRRQLFTILLRCGTVYDGDFQKALFSQPYAASTIIAVNKFLDGYNCLTPPGALLFSQNYGWAAFFGLPQNAEYLTKEKPAN